MFTRLFAALMTLSAATAMSQNQVPAEADTTFFLSPYIVSPTRAHDRETPASFSTLEKDQIGEQFSSRDVPSLLSGLPSITFYSESGNGIGYSYINLRGFSQKRLSVLVNGVPQNDPEDHDVYWVDMPDLLASTGTLQVQRGAGSAFYGPPAIGGSVNIVTNPFSEKPGISVESDFGFQEFGDSSSQLPLNMKRLAVSVNSGLVNRHYMFYGKLANIRSDGYRSHSWVDQSSYFLGAVRVDENFSTRLHVFGGPLNDALAYNGLPKWTGRDPKLRRSNWNDWNTDSSWVGYSPAVRRTISPDGHDTVFAVPRREAELEEFSQPHTELINEYRITQSLTLHSTIFYYQGDGYFDYDGSWADTTTLRLGSAYGIPVSENPGNALIRAFVGNRQWGWLPRFEIDHRSGTMTLGAEIRIHRSTHWGKIQFADHLPSLLDPDYHFYEYNGEKDILSFYLHEMYRATDRCTIMGDLQFIRNRYGIANEKYLGNSFSLPYFFVNPRFGINWNINDAWNTYFSIAYTSQEPRLRNLYAAEDSYFGATPQFSVRPDGGYDFTSPLAKPEKLLDLEAGIGVKTPGSRLSADIYWMEFSDELISNGQVDIFGQPVTGNADRTRHIGFEADGAVTLTGPFELSGNVSLSRNTLVRHRVYVGSTDSSGATTYLPQDLDGNPISGFPSLLGNLRISYRAGDLLISAAVKYVGPFYTENFKNEANRNDDYTVVNLEGSYRLPELAGTSFTVRGGITNLFNRLYFSNGEGDAFYPAAERSYLIGLKAEI